MKNLKSNLAVKIVAIFLILILATVIVGSVFNTIYQAYDLTSNVLFEESRIYSDVMNFYSNRIFNNYIDYGKLQNSMKEENVNFYFDIKDESGTVVYSNHNKNETELRKRPVYTSSRTTLQYNEVKKGVVDTTYNISIYLKQKITNHDFVYYANLVFNMRHALIVIAVVSFILIIMLFVFLLSAAGHRKNTDEIVPSFVDLIPIDLLFLILVSIAGTIIVILNEILYYYYEGIIIVTAIVLTYFLGTLFAMSFAVRCKLGTIWKNSLFWYSIRLIYYIVKWVYKRIKTLFNAIPLIWKTVLIIIGYLFISFFCLALNLYVINIFLLLAASLFICFFAISLNNLKIGGAKIASGILDHKIDTSYMIFDLKDIGENINNISDGMANAVNERMKSEHFKSELITNVSHDIKTPLTSIINYVELLKKEDIENDTVQEYIEILDRQSNKLKKLTEDLIDASKASTGNVSVNITELDVIELLVQSIGEYNEKFKNVGIEPILNLHGLERIVIKSDGRLLWRVFDNLLNNIYKYTMHGTRVYIDVNIVNESVMVGIKNISRDPLNVSADELMERFVRGDSSRTTEGSGLGLSISRSLTEILGGSLNLYIDGDLFKVVIIITI